jgi:methylaspartate mutase sigma subunit
MENHKKVKGNLVMGVIGFDAHVIGNRILEYAFKNKGFNVTNLGIFASQKDFINAAIEVDADIILVGSIYGHAELDCQGLREKCIEAGIGKIILYIGGNLAVGERKWEEIEKTFLNMGFNRVFPPNTLPRDVIVALKKDLKI